jgi:hypothetical protein
MLSGDADQFKTFGFVTWKQVLREVEVHQIETELLRVMADGLRPRPPSTAASDTGCPYCPPRPRPPVVGGRELFNPKLRARIVR